MDEPREEGQQYAQLEVQVEPPQAPSLAKAITASEKRELVAVLVCHGMGQQVRFETLDSVARAFRTTAIECGTAKTTDDIAVSLHPDKDSFIGRASVPLTKADGTIVEVHFYEAYWAPITEGQVTLWETLTLFVSAGWSGLKFAYADGVFDRWMFGGRQEFEIPVRRIMQLGMGLWALLLLTLALAAVTLLPIANITDLVKSSGLDPQIAVIAAAAFALAALLATIMILATLIAPHVGLGNDSVKPRSVNGGPLGILAPRKWRRNVMLVGVVATVIAASVGDFWFGERLYHHWLLPAVTNPSAHVLSLIVGAILFLIEVAGLVLVVKGFIIEFAGDVAAYVSPFKVSKFEEIRHKIQERGRVAAQFIYSAKSGTAPLYHAVMVVGHSLGSVLAYDTLNDAVNRDIHEGGWADGSAANAYEVIKRTKLLLTFGSPLDKTAFIFRTQKPQAEIDVREALASSMQPMILDYANRPNRWINLWSRSDWISGPLGYYDAPGNPQPGDVINIENNGSTLAFRAHTEYWTGHLLPGVLHSAVIGICPRAIDEAGRQAILAAFPGCVVAV
jgi:hypothetical protein